MVGNGFEYERGMGMPLIMGVSPFLVEGVPTFEDLKRGPDDFAMDDLCY